MTPGELTFGEEIVVAPDARPEYRPGSRAWVVGLPTEGRDLVTVEFEDGTSVDAPLESIVPSGSDKRRFLAVYDYGTGGGWVYVWARSPEEIEHRFRDLKIVDAKPAWMNAEEQARTAELMTFDVDSVEPTDWIFRLVRDPG